LRFRLTLLLILLCLTVAGWRYVDRNVAPLLAPPVEPATGPSHELSAAEKEKLKALQTQFAEERDKYLKLKNAGAPSAEVGAQYQRVLKAIDAVKAIGGTEAIRAVPRSRYAPTSKP
jgi:hypothetical protein